ncbi:signal peptide peptidase SppA [Candidatus Cloacimonadota bacterium]
MKRAILVLTLVVLTGLSWAGIYYPGLPVAGSNGHYAARVNPAALAFGNGYGLALERTFDDEFQTYTNEFSLFLNMDGLSYLFDHRQDDFHKLSISSKLFRNFYHGFGYEWSNKHFKKGDLSYSLLFRPNEYVSMGVAASEIFDFEKSEYVMGTAVRPLAFSGDLGSRFSLTADIHYLDENWDKPVLGLQSELIDGVFLGGNYQLETETIGLSFGLNFGQLGIGSNVALDKENDPKGGNWYIYLSGKDYRSFLDSKKPNQIYDLKLQGDIKEKKTGMQLGPFTWINQKEKTLSEMIEQVNKLKDEERIQGILFKNANFNLSFAGIQELQEALLEFKSAGKQIIFYYEEIGNKEYIFAASVADQIYMHPSGWLNLKGLSISVPYVSELLDTLGIGVENFRSHHYKTAGNMFSETEMTEAEKETYEYLLQDLYNESVKMIEQGRGEKLTKSVEELIDNGPYFVAKDALDNGLLDGLIHEDELKDKLENLVNDAQVINKMSENKIRYDWSDEKKDKIAVIYCIGNITMGKSKLGKTMGSITTSKAIKRARENKEIKGIILRVDSGGGSALASDIINREVELCNSGDNKKPVVISMAGAAASGGYFISAMSDMIIAQPTTITGSIGVVGIFFNFEELYDKVHINWSTIKRGKYSDIGRTSRSMTNEEKSKVSGSIASSYDQFITYVARGRNMDKEEVHEIAQGRVWTGNQALERGLIDKLGGMKLAMEEISKLAELENEIELVEFTGGRTGNLEFGIGMNSLINDNIPSELKSLYDSYSEWKLYGNEKILKVMPYNFEIQ